MTSCEYFQANSKMQQLTERIGDRRMLDEEHVQLNRFRYDPVAMAKPIKAGVVQTERSRTGIGLDFP